MPNTSQPILANHPISEDARGNIYVVFRVDRQTYALDLKSVKRALRMVAITPLPQAPRFVLGAINVAGEVLHVLDLRSRINLPPRAPALNDRLLVVESRGKSMALVVDEIQGIQELSVTPGASSKPGIGVSANPIVVAANQQTNLILILDIEHLL